MYRRTAVMSSARHIIGDSTDLYERTNYINWDNNAPDSD